MFQQLLREEDIQIGLKAKDVESAFQQMIDKVPGWSLSFSEKKAILKALLTRERFGTTALGDGVALPRCQFAGIQYPRALLGISQEGIPFPSLDGAPVYVIFMLVWPEADPSDFEKQRVLHSAEVFFRDRFLRERIKLAQSREEVLEVILREAEYLKEGRPSVAIRQA